MNCFTLARAPSLCTSGRSPVSLIPLLQQFEIIPASRLFSAHTQRRSLWSSPLRLITHQEKSQWKSAAPSQIRAYAKKYRPVKPSRPTSRSQSPSHEVPKISKAQSVRPIIRDFLELPGTYDDEVGLPFRNTPLTKEELVQIFGKDVGLEAGTRCLMRLHGRRVAGILEDPNLDDIPQANEHALQWLRDNVPVDEIDNAALRAEQELNDMDAETLREAERLGIYAPNTQDVSSKPGGVYGQGAFDRIRAENNERFERLEAEKAQEADQQVHQTGTLVTQRSVNDQVKLQRLAMEEKLDYWKKRAMLSADDVQPDITNFSRLWPSGLMLLITLTAAYGFAIAYEPPTSGTRLWPDLPPAAATIVGLIAINTAIFVAWRIPQLWRPLNKYFLQVPGYPYAITLLTSILSHQSLTHLAFNMAVLFMVGTRLHQEIGRGNFLAVFFAAGAVGCMTSLTYRVVMNSLMTSSLGASGALCGIVGTWCILHHDGEMGFIGLSSIEGFPNLTGLTLLSLFVGWEIFSIVARKRFATSKTDHWAHLGGYVTGIGGATLINNERRRRKDKAAIDKTKKGIMDQFRGGKK